MNVYDKLKVFAEAQLVEFNLLPPDISVPLKWDELNN